jgi:hypothetical protein
MYELTPLGTSCIFIEFKLHNDSSATIPYNHQQINIVKDTTGQTTEPISIKIDTSNKFNEFFYIQGKTRGKILSEVQPILYSVCSAPTYYLN